LRRGRVGVSTPHQQHLARASVSIQLVRILKRFAKVCGKVDTAQILSFTLGNVVPRRIAAAGNTIASETAAPLGFEGSAVTCQSRSPFFYPSFGFFYLSIEFFQRS